MNGFYYALDIIKNQLELDNDVNVVNTGIIEDVLLKKADLYPYSHILVNNATLNGSTWSVSYSVICMDIVDISKEQTTDIFRGQNNVQDVLNTQLVVINRLLEVLRRGENTNLYQLDGSPNCEPFEDRFEHGVAGWTVTFDLLIPNDITVCDNDVTPVKLCPDFEYTITDSDSNVLYTGDILSGDSLVQVITNATVTNSLGTVLGSVLAQGSLELPDVNNIDSDGSTVPTPAGVAFTCTPVAPCDDATAVLKDTSGTTISTTDIPSGASADIIAPDATYTVQYEDATPIDSGSIVSGGSVLVEVPNPVVCDDASVTLNSVLMTDIPSGSTENIKVLQSNGMTEVGSKQGVNWRIADSDISLNGGAFLSVKAEDSQDISLVDQDDFDITPISVIGNVIKVDIPSGGFTDMKLLPRGLATNFGTGDQPTRGRTTDFFTLNYTNEWGHAFRFVGQTGGYTDGTSYFDVTGVATTKALAFPNDIIFDFTSRNETEILSYYIGDSTTYRSYTTSLPLHVSSTFGGLTAWYLANDLEMRNIMSLGSYDSLSHWMGHKPFEFTSSRRYFVSSTRSSSNLVAIDMQGIAYSLSTTLTNALLQIYVRYTTLTEMGL